MLDARAIEALSAAVALDDIAHRSKRVHGSSCNQLANGGDC
jgi:hypothetical protein